MRSKGWSFRDIWAVRLLFLIPLIASCVNGFLVGGTSYDGEPFTVQTLNLFNQNGELERSSQWRGDWIFRRERLSLVDNGLRRWRPDVILFQELVAKGAAHAASDKQILSAGALEGYSWKLAELRRHPGHFETEYLATAMGSPFRPKSPNEPTSVQEIANAGQLFVTTVVGREEPFIVVNLYLNEVERQNQNRVLTVLEEQLRLAQNRSGVCRERVIFAGRVPTAATTDFLQRILERFNLKDSAEEYCDGTLACVTSSPANDVYRLAFGEIPSKREERVLVPRGALVYSAGVNFNVSGPLPSVLADAGIGSLWPSSTFGWKVTLRMERCDSGVKSPD